MSGRQTRIPTTAPEPQTEAPFDTDIPPMQYEPFKLKTKIEDMMKYGKKAVASFPRRERQTADAIRASMATMYRLSIVVEKRYFRKTTMQELDVELDVLRHLIRLAADKDYYDDTVAKRDGTGRPVKGEDGKTVMVRMQPPLPQRKDKVWSGLLDEIGRMIGGYMKTLK